MKLADDYGIPLDEIDEDEAQNIVMFGEGLVDTADYDAEDAYLNDYGYC
jgi:hypothetical protein